AGVSHGLMRGLSDARLARTLVAMHQAPQDEWTLPPDAAGVSHGLMRGLSDARLARTLVAMHQAPQDEWTL
ncbi:AraC family transcriptional regulator, partial [Stenotrophomonas maltophilia]